MKFTEETMVFQVLDYNEEFEHILERHGMTCLGCPGAVQETLKEAAEAHGIDVKALLEDLNKEV